MTEGRGGWGTRRLNPDEFYEGVGGDFVFDPLGASVATRSDTASVASDRKQAIASDASGRKKRRKKRRKRRRKRRK